MAKIPNTNLKIRTSHSLAIRVKGKTVGLMQRFGYTLSRTITPIFELNPDTTGEPVDLVPGNVTTPELTVTRVDLQTDIMEEVFGGTRLDMLSDQQNPFEVVEVWKYNDGTSEVYIYEGCWFSRISRMHDATGDRVVRVEGTINYTRRRRVA
jgi:hypothetical protein